MTGHTWLALSLALLAWAPVPAHQDPWGDTHPQVEIERGCFAVYFQAAELDRDRLRNPPAYRVLYSPEGKTVVPRHRVKAQPGTKSEGPSVILVRRNGAESKARFALKKAGANGAIAALPIDPVECTALEEFSVTGEQVAATWALPDQRRTTDFDVTLMLSCARLKGFTPGKTVKIGRPATIYDFPTASPPVWAAGRWWVAWVRARADKMKQNHPVEAWQTVLSGYDPSTNKLEHKPVAGLSNWNSHMSMKALDGWLCIAWHASVDGSYPGVAKIVTAFEKLPAK